MEFYMEEGKTIVVVLLGIAFFACSYIVWLLLFRLRSHLISTSYKFILVAKIFFTLLSGSGIYLLLWPITWPPHVVVATRIGWFAAFAVGCISSAIGFWLYARDVHIVLNSDSYTHELPVTPADGTHESEPPQKEA